VYACVYVVATDICSCKLPQTCVLQDHVLCCDWMAAYPYYKFGIGLTMEGKSTETIFYELFA
jgi:hypothetical protein